MSETTIPSGEPTTTPVEPTTEVTTPTEEKSVSYDSHRKLLGEKKRLAEQLTESLAKNAKNDQEKNEAEEKRLKDNEEWKTYAEKKEQEANEARAKLTETTSQIADAKKLDAFLNTLDAKIDRKYWGFIDTDSIVTNPESGEIDEMSVAKAVEAFKANYAEIIQYPGKTTGLPNESPKPGTSTLTYDEWTKLPVKEMKARQAEVMANDRA
ncbi:hypothetical protein DRQ25_11110 [Candidatus Fermentibacteria bacterium]|nr:MAG: hypothetical protein DRQ25_11110 [Candidatus Fermentibacteria bacterium]